MSGESTGRALGRRTFLARVAVAGGAAWAAPTIITMRQANAASLTSAPPDDPDDPPIVDDKTLVNKTSFSKFGIQFGEVTIFFRKR